MENTGIILGNGADKMPKSLTATLFPQKLSESSPRFSTGSQFMGAILSKKIRQINGYPDINSINIS